MTKTSSTVRAYACGLLAALTAFAAVAQDAPYFRFGNGRAPVAGGPSVDPDAGASLRYPSVSVRSGEPFVIRPTLSALLNGAVFERNGGDWPAGVDVDPASGAVSGTAVDPGTKLLTVRARDTKGTYVSNAFAISVGNVAPLIVSMGGTYYLARVGTYFDAAATTPATGVSWSVEGGRLPTGLSLTQDGHVRGTPTRAERQDGIVLGARTSSASGSTAPFSIDVKGLPTLSAEPSYVAYVGRTFSAPTAVANLIGAPTYTVSGVLPSGLSLDGTGRIVGTPTSAMERTGIVVGVRDAADGAIGSTSSISISVVNPGTELTVSGVPSTMAMRVGSAYASEAPTALNASGPVTWSLAPTGTALPAGLSVVPSTGVVSGTTTTASRVDGVVLQAANGNRTARSRPFSVHVAPPLQVSGVNAAYATKVAQPVAVEPRVAGLLGSPRWELTGGDLPPGMSLDGYTGRVSGVPLVSGNVPTTAPTDNLSLKILDSFDNSVAHSGPFSIFVETGLVVTGPNSLVAKTGRAFTTGAAFAVANDTSPVTWSLAAGNLPAGLTGPNPATGEISGIPTTEGNATGLRLRATRSDGVSGETPPFVISVVGSFKVSVAPLQIFRINRPATFQPGIENAVGDVRWSLADGTLPVGMALDPSTGTVSGTPTALSEFRGVRFRATDSTTATAISEPFTIRVVGALRFAGDYPAYYEIPAGRGGTPIHVKGPGVINAVGTPTYVWAPTSPGPKAPGDANLAQFKVDPASGDLVGNRPSGGDTYGWRVRATDETGATADSNSIISVATKAVEYHDCGLTLPACTTTFGTLGKALMSESGPAFYVIGKATYSWAPGAQPRPWMTLDPDTGTISGTPTETGDFFVRTQVTDSHDNSVTLGYHPRQFRILDVANPPTTGNGMVKGRSDTVLRTQIVDSTGLTWPTTRSTVDFKGSNVAWDSSAFSPTNDRSKIGWVTGSYPRVGYYPGIQAGLTGANGVQRTTTTDFLIAPPLSIEAPALDNVCIHVGDTFDSGPVKVGGVWGTPTFRFMEFGQPYQPIDIPGLNVDQATGRVTGTATEAFSNYYISLGVVDSWDGAAKRTIDRRFYVRDALSITYQGQNLDARASDDVYWYPSILGNDWDQANFDITIASGRLPKGLALDPKSGVIQGRIGEAGSFPVTVRIDDRKCGVKSAQAQVTINVAPSLVLTVPDPLYMRQGVYGETDPAPEAAMGAAAVRWGKTGTLPSGTQVVIDNGRIAGTPLASGIYPNLRLTGNDGVRTVQSNPFQVIVMPGLFVETGSSYEFLRFTNAKVQPLVGNSSGVLSWTISGTLPAGLSMNAATGTISGFTTETGTSGPLTLIVADALGGTASSRPFTIKVIEPSVAPDTDDPVIPQPPRTGGVWRATLTMNKGLPCNGCFFAWQFWTCVQGTCTTLPKEPDRLARRPERADVHVHSRVDGPGLLHR